LTRIIGQTPRTARIDGRGPARCGTAHFVSRACRACGGGRAGLCGSFQEVPFPCLADAPDAPIAIRAAGCSPRPTSRPCHSRSNAS
jgi:hypothetical protein